MNQMNPTDNLTKLVDNLKTDLINSMQAKGSMATGQTVQQITIVNNGKQVQLQIPAYLMELEKGRGPTGKNPVPGNPPMIVRIQEWCRAKGLPDKAAWAVKKKIDKVGYPAKPGILTEPLGDDNINQRLDETSAKMADELVNQILNNLAI
jgi:hypothetical protein